MAEKYLIYAVDDEQNIRELYSCALDNAGFASECFKDGNELFSAVKTRLPSLILLDIMLEGEDGYAILSRLKREKETKDIPVVMVSAKGEEISKVKGLNLGADDYIAKPFGVMELIARIKANLRKSSPKASVYIYKDVVMDDGMHSVTSGGKPVSLTLKEYGLLKLLLIRAPEVVGRTEILSLVWGEDYFGETRTLDIHIASLRKILSDSTAEIITVRGVGYQLK